MENEKDLRLEDLYKLFAKNINRGIISIISSVFLSAFGLGWYLSSEKNNIYNTIKENKVDSDNKHYSQTRDISDINRSIVELNEGKADRSDVDNLRIYIGYPRTTR